MNALIDEFNSNNRSEEFINELVEVLIDLFVYKKTALETISINCIVLNIYNLFIFVG